MAGSSFTPTRLDRGAGAGGGLALYGFRMALAGRPAWRLLAEEAG